MTDTGTIKTFRLCGRCSRSFDRGDLVNTWCGDHWITTCVACNHEAHHDQELLDRISRNHQHGHWTQAVAWEMAMEAAGAYARVCESLDGPGAAGRLNAFVDLLARIERRTTADVLLEVLKRAQVMRLVPTGDQNGGGDGGARRDAAPSSPFTRGGAA